jgi:uncharacterized membrane protein YdjX (TVP38/TMEM64 family)
MSLLPILKGLLLLGLLVVLGIIFRGTELDLIFDKAWIDTDVRGHGLTGEVLFVGLCGVGTAFGLPRQIVSFLSGYAFGFVTGTGLALVATTLGCVTAFTYARLLGQDFVRTRLKNKLGTMDSFLRKNPFSMTLLIRFLPFGNNLMTSLTAGVSSVPAVPFILGSMIGFIPQTAIFALAGAGVTIDRFNTIAISAGLFVVSAILGVYLHQKFRDDKKQHRQPENNDAFGD